MLDWLERRNDPGPSGQVYGEAPATRAVLSGRRTCEHALLHAGQLDELELHLVPAMLGQGRRLFDHLPRNRSSSSSSADWPRRR